MEKKEGEKEGGERNERGRGRGRHMRETINVTKMHVFPSSLFTVPKHILKI